jgi:hypothetical protein
MSEKEGKRFDAKFVGNDKQWSVLANALFYLGEFSRRGRIWVLGKGRPAPTAPPRLDDINIKQTLEQTVIILLKHGANCVTEYGDFNIVSYVSLPQI